ncbi:MAG TPA: hypothetical protein VM912_22475 [Terriglobales bacterium]|nr:hypothetical protein [Terriglobales bacterium]
MKKLISSLAISTLLGFSVACNYRAAPEPNASKSEQQAREVKTPAGGGPETTNKQSVADRAPAPENTQQGSAVPPAAADQTRPHPQQAQTSASPAMTVHR